MLSASLASRGGSEPSASPMGPDCRAAGEEIEEGSGVVPASECKFNNPLRAFVIGEGACFGDGAAEGGGAIESLGPGASGEVGTGVPSRTVSRSTGGGRRG